MDYDKKRMLKRHQEELQAIEIATVELLFQHDAEGKLINPPRFSYKLPPDGIDTLVAVLRTAMDGQQDCVELLEE